ncbi:MAG: glycosyl hydrolase 2 galactose-binding domain-containing protein [Phycisphaerae bacterium]
MKRRKFIKLAAAAVTASAAGPLAAGAAETEPQLTDLAFGRPVRVSSTAYAPTPGFCAVDGTRWSWWTSAPEDPSWIEIDLQTACVIHQVRIFFPHEKGDQFPRPSHAEEGWTPASAVFGSYAVAYDVELSVDGKKWNNVYSTNNGVGGDMHLRVEPQAARYVRLTSRSRSWRQYGVAISSIQVMGTCSVPRPAPGGWTAPRAARQSSTPVLPPREDGRLLGGWEMAMIGPGGTHAPAEEVSAPMFDSRNWYQATVPGTVLTTLVDQGVFPEPLFGLNNLQIPEALNKYAWWYRKTFTLPGEYKNKRTWIHFEGINYTAEVWLNGRRLGEIKGAFIRGLFDITDAVKARGTNVLAVKVHPVSHPGLPDEQSWKTGFGPNGGEPTRNGPNFLCTVGWDWIPGIRDRCTGIWSHVYLTSTGPVVLRNSQVKTKLPLPELSSATLSVGVEAFNAGSQAVHGLLKGNVGDIAFEKHVTIEAGARRIVNFNAREFPQLVMHHPELWWPNGYGGQYLYELNLAFEIGGIESDRIKTSFGVREFEYEKRPDLVIKCNGHKIMCRGGDWGLDEAMKRIPYKSMDTWIRMHHLANLNIIRNWTGESNSEEFFALCDKYGVMVWTEFWMANPGDGPDPDNPALLLANAEDTFKRYRNHPCIVIWCGRNEGPPPAIINAALERMANELDGTRYYQPGSSIDGAQSGGAYCFTEPAVFFEPRFGGFMTEIGSVSIPTLDSLRTTMPEDQLWPNHNNTWAYHDYCRGGGANIATFEAGMFRRFGPTTSIEDFVNRSQILNYESYRGMFEGYLSKLWHTTSGVILWMSQPAQHSVVQQIYAYDMQAHASFYAAKKGCESIHVQLSPVDFSVDLINLTLAPMHNVTVSALVYNLDGSLAGQTRHAMDAVANAKTPAFKLTLPEPLSEVYFVRLTIRDAAGALLGDNLYWQSRNNGSLRSMSTMPRVRPAGRVRLATRGEMFIAMVELHNSGKTPAIAISLTPCKEKMAGPARRILPAFIDDNYFSLMPGESKTVRMEFYTEDAAGCKPVVEIAGWNIAQQAIACDGGEFEPIG